MPLTARSANPQDPSSIDRTTLAAILVGGLDIPNLTSFSYSSDVMQVGDPFALEIPDPRNKYKGKLAIGSSIEFYLANQNIAGGSKTLKTKGRVIERTCDSEGGRGTIIRITGADLGWHLIHCDAPIWFQLRGITLETLAKACIFPDQVFRGKKGRALDKPTNWGFEGIRFNNDVNRNKRVNNGRREAAINNAPTATSPIAWIQTEPGEKLADILITACRRLGLLVNVSGDGYLQLFKPNYSQATNYTLDYHPLDDPDSARNNVQKATLSEKLEPLGTDVTCVGEVIWKNETQQALSKDNPNVGKFKGKWPQPPVQAPVDFLMRMAFCDPDRLSKTSAQGRARWKYERGLFDSWTYTVTVRGHGQNGLWWEADTMVDVDDTINDVHGAYYVAAVQCSRTMRDGDTTTITIKKPFLLAA